MLRHCVDGEHRNVSEHSDFTFAVIGKSPSRHGHHAALPTADIMGTAVVATHGAASLGYTPIAASGLMHRVSA